MQYSNFKDTLQNIASQIGNVEQEVEEHKYVARFHDSSQDLLASCVHDPLPSLSNIDSWLSHTNQLSTILTHLLDAMDVSSGHCRSFSARSVRLSVLIQLAENQRAHKTATTAIHLPCPNFRTTRLGQHKAITKLSRVQHTNHPSQTRPRHPHTPSELAQMLPHDQRRASGTHGRRCAPATAVEFRQHEQSPRGTGKAVQDQAGRYGEVEGTCDQVI